MHLILPRFRDVPVLAEETAHVAAGGPHAEDARSGKKMIERLFFDGINLERSGRAVAKAVEFAVSIDSNEAEARLSGMNMAMARAEVAVDSAAGLRFPPARFVKRFRFLEDV